MAEPPKPREQAEPDPMALAGHIVAAMQSIQPRAAEVPEAPEAPEPPKVKRTRLTKLPDGSYEAITTEHEPTEGDE